MSTFIAMPTTVTAGTGISAPLTGGSYVVGVDTTASFSWSGTHTHTEDVTFDGATAGRDITFDRSENRLRFEDNAQLTFGAGGSTPYDAAMYSDGTQVVVRMPPSGGVTADMLIKAVGDPYTGDPIPQLDGGNDNNWPQFGVLVLRYQVFAWDSTGTYDSYLLSQDHSEDGYIYLSYDSAANVGKIEVGGADNSTNVIAFGLDNALGKVGIRTSTPHNVFEVAGDSRARTTSGWLVGGSSSTSDHSGRFYFDNSNVVIQSTTSSRPMRVAGGANTASNGNGSALDLMSGPSAGNGGSALVGYAVPTTQGTGTTVRNPVEHFRAGEGCFTITHPAEADGVGNKVLRVTSVTTNDDPTADIYQARTTTTNNSATTIKTVGTTTDKSIYIEALIIGRRTGGVSGTNGDSCAYKIAGLFKNVGGTVTQVGSTVDLLASGSMESNSSCAASFSISSTNVLVQVTGDTNNNYTWHTPWCLATELGT